MAQFQIALANARRVTHDAAHPPVPQPTLPSTGGSPVHPRTPLAVRLTSERNMRINDRFAARARMR